ncbi:MAG: hypothetical protein II008_02475 [Oscillospiraceae bacterium]|nr:hypothetical protein [Oscillospiraceae bacterium]
MGTNEEREERKEMPKICPLFRVGEMISGYSDVDDCIKNHCAWYDKENKCCVLVTLARKGGNDDEAAEE